MNYRDYLKSEDWLTKRYLKRLKANNCAICNSKEKLDVSFNPTPEKETARREGRIGRGLKVLVAQS